MLNRIEAVSPVAVLQRGYALVYHDEKLVLDAAELYTGDPLEIRLANGTVTASVTGIRKGDTSDEL